MPIPNVSIDDAVAASLMNQIIDRLNILDAAGTRTIVTGPASGVYAIPSGVTKIRVTICGGGGSGTPYSETPTGGDSGGTSINIGWRGGDAPMGSKLLTGLSPGASIAYVVGRGGVYNGAGPTNSNFGAYMSSSAGGGGGFGGGGASGGSKGADGSLTGADIRLGPQTYLWAQDIGFGQGGLGLYASASQSNGGPGLLIIEY